jgi:hypothetical protein
MEHISKGTLINTSWKAIIRPSDLCVHELFLYPFKLLSFLEI